MEVMEEWFRVDARPFKQALLNIIKRWSYMFKQHLMEHVTNRFVHVHVCTYINLATPSSEEYMHVRTYMYMY